MIGRNAVIRKDGVDIGYAKGVTAGIDADVIKDYALNDDKPAILQSGNKSFPISIEKMYLDNTYATLRRGARQLGRERCVERDSGGNHCVACRQRKWPA